MIQDETVFKFTFFLIPATAILLSFVEGFLITKLGWADKQKAWLYAFVSNLISGFVMLCLTFGFVFSILLAMSSGSASATAEKIREGDSAIIASLIGWLFWACLTLIPTAFFLSKRWFLRLFQIQTGWKAWLYALISSVVNLLLTFTVPILFALLYIYYVVL